MSTSDDDAVFESAKRFAVQFSGFVKAAELWESVSSVKKARDEAQSRLDNISKEVQRIEATANDKAAKILQQAAAELRDAQAKADAIIAKTKAYAETYTRQAQADAAKSKDDAATYSAAAAEARATLDELNKTIAAQRSLKNQLETEVSSAHGKLLDMTSDLQKFRKRG